MVQGAKTIILNNSYKIYHVKCPVLVFASFFPYATRTVLCGMDEILDVGLPP